MSDPKPLSKQLQSAQRRARLKPMTHAERIAKAKRAKRKQREAESRTLLASGLAPDFAARLQDAAKRAETDPDARAMLDKARLAKRIEVAKRESGIGDPQRTPTRFMGATVTEYEAAADSPLSPIPPRLSDSRKAAEEPKKGRRNAPR